MITKNLETALRELFEMEVEAAPKRHRDRTDLCPPLELFSEGVVKGWDSDRKAHVSSCHYCQKVTAMQWRIAGCPHWFLLAQYKARTMSDMEAMRIHLERDRCAHCVESIESDPKVIWAAAEIRLLGGSPGASQMDDATANLEWPRREREHDWMRRNTLPNPPRKFFPAAAEGPGESKQVDPNPVLAVLSGAIFRGDGSSEPRDLDLLRYPTIHPDGFLTFVLRLPKFADQHFALGLVMDWNGTILEVPAGVVIGGVPVRIKVDLSVLPSELRQAWQSKGTWEIAEIPFRFVLRPPAGQR